MSVRLLCDKFWAWRMREYPELATAVGLHDNDHLWDDVSELAIQKRKVAFVLGLKEKWINCRVLSVVYSGQGSGNPAKRYKHLSTPRPHDNHSQSLPHPSHTHPRHGLYRDDEFQFSCLLK